MFFIWCFNFSIFTLIAFIALYFLFLSMNLHEFQHSSFQMPFSILWLCDTVCLFTFHFTVMLIANPFPSVSVGRRTLESLQCSPGRSETGLRHAWSSLKYVSLRERERSITIDLMFLCYDILRHCWKHPNVFGGVVRSLDEHMFRTGRSRPYHEIREVAPS